MASIFASVAAAGEDLNATVVEHVLPRFDREARLLMAHAGAHYISSRWNGDSRTLIAVGQMQPRSLPAAVDVVLTKSTSARHAALKADHVARLCAHPSLRIIDWFLAKHDVSVALVYVSNNARAEPTVVDISHADLRDCAG